MESELVERLESHPRVQDLRARGFEPFQQGPDGLFRLGLNEQRRCHFLREDRLCGLHADSGPASKPRACRQFPFHLLETPDGTQVGLSFVCTAVQQDHGTEWSAHEAGLRQLQETGSYPRLGFGPIAVREGETVDWAGYLAWERRALEEHPSALLGDVEPAAIFQLSAFLVGYLEHSQPAAMAGVVSQILQEGAYVSERFLARLSARALFPPAAWDERERDVGRYLRHLVERKFLLLGPSLRARLAALWAVEMAIHHYWRALGDFWAALELVEAEFVGHVEGLESFYAQIESVISR